MKYIGLSISFLLINFFTIAQDVNFSQYNSARLFTNPAFAGTDSAFVISTGYRMQWPNIDGGYKTFYASADQYVHFLRGGIGISYLHDNESNGGITTNKFDLSYAPHFELFKHKLAIQPAISIGYFQKQLNWNKFSFGDQIDPGSGFIYNTNEVQQLSAKSNIDFSTGLLLYNDRFYCGIAVFHLTQPDVGFLGQAKLPIKTSVHAGYNFNFPAQKMIISPTILQVKQADFQILLPGVSLKYKKAVVGLSYRNKDAFIITTQYQNRFLKIGYSYDYTTSRLTNKTSGGSHEIQLSWLIQYEMKRNGIRTLKMI
jgi:type IX secretion system PorP/SprF family membrane protein